jgi:anti-sigma B factor antagonist
MTAFAVAEPRSNVRVVAFGAQVLGGSDAIELAQTLRSFDATVETVIFDLSLVDVMNSSGLGMLVRSLTTLKSTNVALRLAAVPERVMALLTMTHLTMVFEIHPTVDLAVSTV